MLAFRFLGFHVLVELVVSILQDCSISHLTHSGFIQLSLQASQPLSLLGWLNTLSLKERTWDSVRTCCCWVVGVMLPFNRFGGVLQFLAAGFAHERNLRNFTPKHRVFGLNLQGCNDLPNRVVHFLGLLDPGGITLNPTECFNEFVAEFGYVAGFVSCLHSRISFI